MMLICHWNPNVNEGKMDSAAVRLLEDASTRKICCIIITLIQARNCLLYIINTGHVFYFDKGKIASFSNIEL